MPSFQEQAQDAAQFAASLSAVEAAALGAAGATVKLRNALGAIGVISLTREFESYNRVLHNTRLSLGGSAEGALKFADSVRKMTTANVLSRKALADLYTEFKRSYSIITQTNVSMEEMASRLQKDFPDSARQAASQVAKMAEQTSYFRELTDSSTSSTVAFLIALQNFGIEGARALQSIRGETINLSQDQNALLTSFNETQAAGADLAQSLTKAFQTPMLGVLGLTREVRNLFDALFVDDQGKINQLGKALAPIIQGFIAIKAVGALRGIGELLQSTKTGASTPGAIAAGAATRAIPVIVTNISQLSAAVGGVARQTLDPYAVSSVPMTPGGTPAGVLGRARAGLTRIGSGISRVVGGAPGVMGLALGASQIYGGYEEARLSREGESGIGSTIGGAITGGFTAGMMGFGRVGMVVGGIVGGLGSIISRGFGTIERINQRSNELLSAIANMPTTFSVGTIGTGETFEERRELRVKDLRQGIIESTKKYQDALSDAAFASQELAIVQKAVAERGGIEKFFGGINYSLGLENVGLGYDPYVELEKYGKEAAAKSAEATKALDMRITFMQEYNKLLSEEIRFASQRVEFFRAHTDYLIRTYQGLGDIPNINKALQASVSLIQNQMEGIVRSVGAIVGSELGAFLPEGSGFELARRTALYGETEGTAYARQQINLLPDEFIRTAGIRRAREVGGQIRGLRSGIASQRAQLAEEDDLEKQMQISDEIGKQESKLNKLLLIQDKLGTFDEVRLKTTDEIAEGLAESTAFLVRQEPIMAKIIDHENLRLKVHDAVIARMTREYDLQREIIAEDVRHLGYQEQQAEALKRPAYEIAAIRKAQLSLMVEDRKEAQARYERMVREKDEALSKQRQGIKLTEEEAQAAKIGQKELKQAKNEVAAVDAAIAKQVDYIRRGWEEMFTQQALNLPTGSYLLPTMTGLMEKGTAFMPFTPQRMSGSDDIMGHGTYGGLMGATYSGAMQFSQEQYARATGQLVKSTIDIGNALDTLANRIRGSLDGPEMDDT